MTGPFNTWDHVDDAAGDPPAWNAPREAPPPPSSFTRTLEYVEAHAKTLILVLRVAVAAVTVYRLAKRLRRKRAA